MVARIKKFQKTRCIYFWILVTGGPPTQSTGPQPIQLVPKIRFLQISQQRSLKSKKFKKRGAFVFQFCFWADPPPPVNWSLTHSTGPQTLCFADISVMVTQIKKIPNTKCIFYWIMLLGGPSPPSQLVPNPFNWSLSTVFCRYLGNGRSNPKKSKNEVHSFSNFASGRTFSNQSTGP